MVVSAGKARSFFSLSTPNRGLFYQVDSMSNAESDRKPDGSAEDDDEPDEWCVWWRWFWWDCYSKLTFPGRDTRIFSTGCAEENTKLNDCFYEKKDWRACKEEVMCL